MTTTTSPTLEPREPLHDEPTAQGSTTIEPLTLRYAALRDESHDLARRVDDGHRNARRLDFDKAVMATAKRAPRDLLDVLAIDRGLSWAAIARLVGVSVSGVRKWRSTGGLAPESRLAVAKLVTLLDLLEQVGPIQEPGGWLDMHLREGFRISAADLYRAGHVDEILDYAAGRLAADDVLDRVDPDWRTSARLDWEVALGDDGERYIKRRD